MLSAGRWVLQEVVLSCTFPATRPRFCGNAVHDADVAIKSSATVHEQCMCIDMANVFQP